VFGLIWSLVIFNLDRFIVAASGPGDGKDTISFAEFRTALPRLIMAVLIGIVLAAPLEIRVMKSEIDAALTLAQLDKVQELNARTDAKLKNESDRFDAELARRRFDGESWSSVVREIVDALPQYVYLSFDIDGLDPTLCPHTGTPVPGGLQFQEACALLSAVAKSGRTIVGFDLCEVAPGPDGDEWDGNVGARLLYKMVGATLRSRGET
jgi:hypothetical protein